MRATTQPVIRAVYETILRDEARHCRFGSLYFEWASRHWDEAERARLAGVALDVLTLYAGLVRGPQGGSEASPARPVSDEEAIELGWFEPTRYHPLARSAILDEIVPQLCELSLPIDTTAVAALFF